MTQSLPTPSLSSVAEQTPPPDWGLFITDRHNRADQIDSSHRLRSKTLLFGLYAIIPSLCHTGPRIERPPRPSLLVTRGAAPIGYLRPRSTPSCHPFRRGYWQTLSAFLALAYSVSCLHSPVIVLLTLDPSTTSPSTDCLCIVICYRRSFCPNFDDHWVKRRKS